MEISPSIIYIVILNDKFMNIVGRQVCTYAEKNSKIV